MHVCASFITFYVLLLKETLDVGWVFAQHFCNRLGPSYLAPRLVCCVLCSSINTIKLSAKTFHSLHLRNHVLSSFLHPDFPGELKILDFISFYSQKCPARRTTPRRLISPRFGGMAIGMNIV